MSQPLDFSEVYDSLCHVCQVAQKGLTDLETIGNEDHPPDQAKLREIVMNTKKDILRAFR